MEVPGTAEQRVVVYEKTGSTFALRDDFTTSEAGIEHVVLDGKHMRYFSRDDRVVVEREASHSK